MSPQRTGVIAYCGNKPDLKSCAKRGDPRTTWLLLLGPLVQLRGRNAGQNSRSCSNGIKCMFVLPLFRCYTLRWTFTKFIRAQELGVLRGTQPLGRILFHLGFSQEVGCPTFPPFLYQHLLNALPTCHLGSWSLIPVVIRLRSGRGRVLL